MSKRDELTAEELNEELGLSDEFSLEPVIHNGPTPVVAPTAGKVEVALQKYTHCGVCHGRLHFTYVSDFSRNTTHEKSTCPECSLDTRQTLHRLQ
jgi:hypothetical protein